MRALLSMTVTIPLKRQRNAIESHWHEACPNTVHGATWYWECCCAAVHYCCVFCGVSISIILIKSFAQTYLCRVISSHSNTSTHQSRTNTFFILFLTLPSYSNPTHFPSHLPNFHFRILEILCNKAKLVETSNVSTILGSSTNANLNGTTSSGDSTMPPNYDEIDPPPSYSTLFPGKSFESTASSATNESTTEAATVTAIPAGSTSQLTSPTVFILPVEIAPTSTTMTRSGT